MCSLLTAVAIVSEVSNIDISYKIKAKKVFTQTHLVRLENKFIEIKS